ncbi:MAG: hypothetical protein ACREKK_09555, partial [Candidatus Methylomirabilales bacterium]
RWSLRGSTLKRRRRCGLVRMSRSLVIERARGARRVCRGPLGRRGEWPLRGVPVMARSSAEELKIILPPSRWPWGGELDGEEERHGRWCFQPQEWGKDR